MICTSPLRRARSSRASRACNTVGRSDKIPAPRPGRRRCRRPADRFARESRGRRASTCRWNAKRAHLSAAGMTVNQWFDTDVVQAVPAPPTLPLPGADAARAEGAGARAAPAGGEWGRGGSARGACGSRSSGVPTRSSPRRPMIRTYSRSPGMVSGTNVLAAPASPRRRRARRCSRSSPRAALACARPSRRAPTPVGMRGRERRSPVAGSITARKCVPVPSVPSRTRRRPSTTTCSMRAPAGRRNACGAPCTIAPSSRARGRSAPRAESCPRPGRCRRRSRTP